MVRQILTCVAVFVAFSGVLQAQRRMPPPQRPADRHPGRRAARLRSRDRRAFHRRGHHGNDPGAARRQPDRAAFHHDHRTRRSRARPARAGATDARARDARRGRADDYHQRSARTDGLSLDPRRRTVSKSTLPAGPPPHTAPAGAASGLCLPRRRYRSRSAHGRSTDSVRTARARR